MFFKVELSQGNDFAIESRAHVLLLDLHELRAKRITRELSSLLIKVKLAN